MSGSSYQYFNMSSGSMGPRVTITTGYTSGGSSATGYTSGVSSATGYSLSRSRSVCVSFMQNNCPYPALACPYSHNKDDAMLCQAWKKGLCDINTCYGRHYYLEKDRVPLRREPLREMSSNTEFSSPLVVKVKTLTEKHRREEVDLETGRRRSWVETENKELIDITGQASPAAAPKKSLLKEVQKKKVHFTQKKKVAQEDAQKKKVADEEAQKKKEMEIRERMREGTSPNKCSDCGKEFKGERGVLAHQRHPQSKCGNSADKAATSLRETSPADYAHRDAIPAAANPDLDGTVYVISDDESD